MLLAVTALTAANAQKSQYKIEESSSKKMPEWVLSTERDYLIVTATGSDIEEAKAAVIENVKKQIAQSIATRVVSESELHTATFEGDGTYSHNQSLETSIMSRTAKLPFIGEISLSKAADYYWEQRYYRTSGRYEYFYAVKYPFSESEMRRLVMEYQEYDRGLNERLARYESDIDFISSIEDIGEAINHLKVFLNEFDTSDPRYNQVQILSNRYRGLYDQITVDWFQEKKGMIVASLTLGGRSISTSQRPVLKSNCATQLSSSYEGNTLVIRYNDDNCYDEDENYIDLRLKAGNKYISERIYFKNTVDISATGVISDMITGEPVAYARLTLIPGGKTATTGRNGVYIFNDLSSGDYSIQVSKAGYKTTEASVSVLSGSTARTDIELTPNPDETAYVPPVPPAENPSPATSSKPEERPASDRPDPVNTVRNGLAAYFRFNGTTRSEVSAIQGNPVNAPKYIPDGPDGTQAISFSSIDGSQISFPKPIIVYPCRNYSITFWMKGFADGHVWSLASGNPNYNFPKLIISNGKFRIYNRYQYNSSAFNNPALDYSWHFIAITVKTDENGNTTGCLYIDGVLTDSISLNGYASDGTTRFLLGGASESGDNAIDTAIDNLRIYSSRALSDKEVAEIYKSEK